MADPTPRICEDCHGDGGAFPVGTDCSHCDGTGTYPPLYSLSEENRERLTQQINEESEWPL